MSLKLNKNTGASGEFVPHPATDAPVKGVIVDRTPLEKKQTKFGEKEVFRIVIESEVPREDGTRYCVWSQSFTPGLNEKSNLRKFLKSAFGRDVAETDCDAEGNIDIDKLLLGHAVMLMISHEEFEGRTFANISAIFPDKSGSPLKPSGKYVRKQDREQKGSGDGNAASYRKAGAGSEDSARESWQTVKVHVGKNAGVQVGDLDAEAVTKLIENWLPKAEANPKPTADDRRLMAALKEAQSLLAGAGAGDEPNF